MLKDDFWLHSGSSASSCANSCTRVFRSLAGPEHAHTLIEYGLVETGLGLCLAAFSERGLCWFEPHPAEDAEKCLSRHWNPATLKCAADRVRARLEEVLSGDSVPLHLRGTDFQLRVWTALLNTSAGETLTYGELAQRIDLCHAARAVGSAVGANHLAFFVPCHRVLPASGKIGKYRWGSALKSKALAQESRQIDNAPLRPAAGASHPAA